MLPYWIEDEDRIWMKGDFAPYGTNIYLLKKSGNNTSSGTDVFDFFDTFATLDAGVWSTINGTPSVVNSILTCANGASAEGVVSTSTFNINHIFECKANYTSDSYSTMGFYTVSPQTYALWYLCNSSYGTDYIGTKDIDTPNLYSDGICRYGLDSHVYGVVYKNDVCMFNVDYSYRGNIITHLPSGNLSITLYQCGKDGTGSLNADWVRVRKHADVEPTVTVFNEINHYKIIVKNNVDQILKDYQFCILANYIDGVAGDTSLEIVPVMQQPIGEKYDLFDDCAFYLNFNNGTNDALGSITCTNYGATLTTDRFNRINESYHFGGIDDFMSISTANPIDLTGDCCIFAIIRNVVNDGSYRIIYDGRDTALHNGILLIISPVNKPYFAFADSSTNYDCFSDTTIIGTTYIAGQRRGTLNEIYINGVLDCSNNTSTNSVVSNLGAVIGIGCLLDTHLFKGDIDTVVAWNKALSASEHKELYELFKQKDIFPNGVQDTEQQRGF